MWCLNPFPMVVDLNVPQSFCALALINLLIVSVCVSDLACIHIICVGTGSCCFICVTYFSGGLRINLRYRLNTAFFLRIFSHSSTSGDKQINMLLTAAPPGWISLSVRHICLKQYDGLCWMTLNVCQLFF